MGCRRWYGAAVFGLVAVTTPVAVAAQADPELVDTEEELRTAFADETRSVIELGGDITLDDCSLNDIERDSSTEVTIRGNGHRIVQTCLEPGGDGPPRILTVWGTGALVLEDVQLSGGTTFGDGGAIRSTGSVTLVDTTITDSHAARSGGAVHAQRVRGAGATFTENSADGAGGAIFAHDVSLDHSTFERNTSGNRGGAVRAPTVARFTGGRFIANTAVLGGGALFTGPLGEEGTGRLSVSESVFRENSSTDDGPVGGGGAITARHPVEIVGSTLADNTAAGWSGGGAIEGSEDVTVRRSIFRRNTTTCWMSCGSGGAISTFGRVTIGRSTFTDNTSSNGGGAVSGSWRIRASNSLFARNHASREGGALSGGDVTAVNTTITNNSSGGGAGGIMSDDTVWLVYSTVADNEGGNIAIVRRLHSFGSVIAGGLCARMGEHARMYSEGYNFSDNTGCGLGQPTDQKDAGDPLLGESQSNGGDTQTRAPMPGSPLLDAIPPADCQAGPAAGLTADQRGFARPSGTGCDIGAVERFAD